MPYESIHTSGSSSLAIPSSRSAKSKAVSSLSLFVALLRSDKSISPFFIASTMARNARPSRQDGPKSLTSKPISLYKKININV